MVGVILLLWRTDYTTLHVVGSSEQEIHAVMEVKNQRSSCLISATNPSPKLNERLLLWSNLKTIVDSHRLPWLAIWRTLMKYLKLRKS